MRSLRATIVESEKQQLLHIVCVSLSFVTLTTQHAMCMRHVDNCNLSVPTLFFPHYLTNGTIFGKKTTCY